MTNDDTHGGSVEVGGNGLCYTCGKKLATQGSWNCATCRGETEAPKVGNHISVQEIQKRLLEKAREARLKGAEDDLPPTDADVENIFQAKFKQPHLPSM